MNEQPENQETKSTSNTKLLFVIGISVILLGGLVYLFYQNGKLEEERIRQDQEISNTYLKLDSVSLELAEKIEKIALLGGEVDTLKALQEQLESDKRQLLQRSSNQQKNISALKDRVAGYKELLLLKDVEIEKLEEINIQLTEENSALKIEKSELNQSIQQLEENKKELSSKVALASRLTVNDFEVTAISDRNKERTGEFRNRHIEKLRVECTLTENDIAPIEGKEILLRIVAPDNNVLFDVTRGSGSFNFEGREKFYTAKQEILYDRSNQRLSFTYEKGSEYMLGKHTVEMYTDDYLLGKGSFVVK